MQSFGATRWIFKSPGSISQIQGLVNLMQEDGSEIIIYKLVNITIWSGCDGVLGLLLLLLMVKVLSSFKRRSFFKMWRTKYCFILIFLFFEGNDV
jgi:hypothetical protein